MGTNDPVKRAEQQRAYRERVGNQAVNAKQREYRDRNHDRILERERTYAAQNMDAILAYQRRAYANDPERFRLRNKVRLHGPFIADDWNAMWEAQGGLCYLCGCDLTAVKRVVIDHDHDCCPPDHSCRACRRGLACDPCNIAVGLIRDDPARLRRMADALETAQRDAKVRMAALPIQPELLSAGADDGLR